MRIRLVLLPLLAACLLPGMATAQSKADQELAELARSVKEWLDGVGQKTVALTALHSGDKFPANGGPGLTLGLRQALAKAGVRVEPRQPYTLAGTYRAALDKDSRRPVLALEVEVVDAQGKAQRVFRRKVFGEAAILEAVSPNVALAPQAEDIDRETALVKSIEKPDAFVEGNRVRVREESPFAIEILVKKGDEYRPVTPKMKDGLPYVSLEAADVYAVRLINKSDHEAAVSLFIDGLHVFRFAEKFTGGNAIPFIVAANKAVTIYGWPIDTKRSDQFLVTSYAKSAAAELKADKAKLGVITAQFAASWKKGDKPPAGESGSRGGTGRGSPVETPFEEVVRNYGAIRAQVSVRYLK